MKSNEINTNGLKEIKAGGLARVFSQLDPNTPVYNNAEGSFIIGASDEDINKLAKIYAPELEHDDDCCCTECDCHDNYPIYGEISQESINYVNKKYNTKNIDNDMANMDTDFAQYYVNKTLQFKEATDALVMQYANDILDNLVEYQNCKNYRTQKEMIRLVNRGQF